VRHTNSKVLQKEAQVKTFSASLTAMLLLTVIVTGCAGPSSSLANNQLVQSIMKQVDASYSQAVGAVGRSLERRTK
jgi:hypothetical protein